MGHRTIGAEDIRQVFGPLDDIVVASFLETGASLGELIEAVGRVMQENGLLVRDEPSSPRVSQLMTLIREIWAEDIEPEEPRTL